MEDQAINLSKNSELFLIRNILNLSNYATIATATTNKQSNGGCSSSCRMKSSNSESNSEVGPTLDERVASNGEDKNEERIQTRTNKESNKLTINQHEQVVDLSLIKSDHQTLFKQQYNDEKLDDELLDCKQSRKRNRRTMFSEWQLSSLEWRFARNKYLTTTDRKHIAKLLSLNQLQVKTWFQVSSLLFSIRLFVCLGR